MSCTRVYRGTPMALDAKRFDALRGKECSRGQTYEAASNDQNRNLLERVF
jgi:hypothetical protein